MMKLYYSPGACSQAVHITLHEAGLDHTSERVDLRSKRTETGADYWAISPKGAVPALDIGNGEVLTENAAILQYLGDLAGDPHLFPPLGDLRRYRVLEWLNFIATELHKGFGPLWNPAASDEAKQGARDVLAKKFEFAQAQLGDRAYVMGDHFTLPDAYLFVMLNWTAMHGIDLARWPGLTAFGRRVAERPAVQVVQRAEGLVEEEVAG